MADTWDQLNYQTRRRADTVWVFEDERENNNTVGVQFEQIVGTQERTLARLRAVQAHIDMVPTKHAEPTTKQELANSDGRHLLIGAIALFLGAAFSGIRLMTGAAFETGYPLSYATFLLIGLGLSAALLAEWRQRRR